MILEKQKHQMVSVGHEQMGDDSIVSWMFAVYDLNNPFYTNKYAESRYFVNFKTAILAVRDSLKAIPSIIRENDNSE